METQFSDSWLAEYHRNIRELNKVEELMEIEEIYQEIVCDLVQIGDIWEMI